MIPEKFEIIWSNDKRLIPIYPLSYENRLNHKLLGYSNRFNDFCYRIKSDETRYICGVVKKMDPEGKVSIYKHEDDYYWFESGTITKLGSPKIVKEEIKKIEYDDTYETLFNFTYWK